MKTFKQIITERLISSEGHRIDEMAQLTRPYDELPQNAEVWIYGENNEQGIQTPHFHLKMRNGAFEFEIKLQNILDMTIWRVTRPTNYEKSWNEFTDVRETVRKWLLKPHRGLPQVRNWQIVVDEWNNNNTTNEIDDSFVMPNSQEL